MIRVLICDDDDSIICQVEKLIKEIEYNHKIHFLIDKKNDGAFMLTESAAFDIAIVDVEMNGVNGIQLSTLLKEANPDIQIIVLTSFQQYLDDAMQVHVFRYLSKPIDKDRFYKSFIAAVKEYTFISKSIVIHENDKIIKIRTKDIFYIENIKYGSIIHTKTNQYKTNQKPKQWSEIINQPSCFVYSHNSILVNLQNVIDFDKSSVTFRINNEKTISTYMSQRKYQSFKKAFFEFAGGIK